MRRSPWLLGIVVATALLARPATADLAGCPMFPANNVWNTRVDHLPVDQRSAAFVRSIGENVGVHPDFGSGLWEGGPIGIPFNKVPAGQPGVWVSFYYEEDSDLIPYPIPADANIEGGPGSTGDRHVLVVKREKCKLFEVFDAHPEANGTWWWGGSGARWNLRSNALRPDTWTSADAAGLPILPGLVRFGEVATGKISHALRFTARYTQKKHVWPARHHASDITDPDVPPMGQRFRLKASFDVSPFPPSVQVILVALKTYGMFLADNGSNWYLSGAPDDRWDNDELHTLGWVKGSDFEAVDSSSLMVHPDSGEARQP
jgi:hypothetical protein